MSDKDKTSVSNGVIESVETTYDEDGAILEVKKIHTPRSPSSVEYSVDSKGNVKPQVKVYHEDPKEALKIAKALIKEAMDYASEISQE